MIDAQRETDQWCTPGHYSHIIIIVHIIIDSILL